jgi:F420H(2)-dependent quinone reductase
MASLSGRLANFLSKHLSGLGRMGTERHVKQFRESNGAKGAEFRGRPVFLLDVVGRSSGELRPVMLMLVRDGDDLLVCGSNGGNPTAPNWYKNLSAAGGADVQVPGERWKVMFRELHEGEKRDIAWTTLVDAYPDFASYQELTDRRLPVAVLSRAT